MYCSTFEHISVPLRQIIVVMLCILGWGNMSYDSICAGRLKQVSLQLFKSCKLSMQYVPQWCTKQNTITRCCFQGHHSKKPQKNQTTGSISVYSLSEPENNLSLNEKEQHYSSLKSPPFHKGDLVRKILACFDISLNISTARNSTEICPATE